MRVYFILYHEATLVNLFEILLYHKHVCESIGEKMIELVDFCARKLTRLNGGYDFRGLEPAANAASSSEKMQVHQYLSHALPNVNNIHNQPFSWHLILIVQLYLLALTFLSLPYLALRNSHLLICFCSLSFIRVCCDWNISSLRFQAYSKSLEERTPEQVP